MKNNSEKFERNNQKLENNENEKTNSKVKMKNIRKYNTNTNAPKAFFRNSTKFLNVLIKQNNDNDNNKGMDRLLKEINNNIYVKMMPNMLKSQRKCVKNL